MSYPRFGPPYCILESNEQIGPPSQQNQPPAEKASVRSKSPACPQSMPPTPRKPRLASGLEATIAEWAACGSGWPSMAVPAPISKRFLALALEGPESDEAASSVRRKRLRMDFARA